MESIFYKYRNKYRNIAVLLVVICAQLVLLAWQVKSDNDVPAVRVWAVTAVAPVASAIEDVRNSTAGFFSNYFELRNAREQSKLLKAELDRLKLENQFLTNELNSARHAERLAGFQAHNPSKMVGARVIGATPGMGTKSELIDRGATSGVRKGMAVVTPDGIVGRVVEVFPFASQVLSVTDPAFAAGVESQKNHVHGVMKGLGNGGARVDYIPAGEKVEIGEMFYTSGEDRVFPKGLPAGKVTSVHDAPRFQEILVDPVGAHTAPEEVLVILDPVHQAIPEAPAADTPVFLGPDVKPDVKAEESAAKTGSTQTLTTADKLMKEYKKIGDAQNHVYGEGLPGSLPPNFNLKVPGVNAPADSKPQTQAKPAAPRAPKPGADDDEDTAPAPKPATRAVPASPAAPAGDGRGTVSRPPISPPPPPR